MKTLVTGGTGFVGRQVVDLLLAHKHQVRLFSRKPELPEAWIGKGVSLFQGDLKDPDAVLDAMEGMDVVFHIGEIKSTSTAAAEKNIKLVTRIVEELQTARVKRLVFISSITVAGIPSAIPATEDTAPAVPLKDHYTLYKTQAEEIIKNSVRGAEYVILRPGVVYGPGSRYLGGMIKAVKRLGPLGLPFLGAAKNLAPFIQVHDLAEAIYAAGAKPDAAGRTINVTDGERTTWADFLHAVADAQGARLRIIPVPPLFFRFPAVFADFFTHLVGASLDIQSYLSYFTRDLHFSNALAKAALGWEPAHRDLGAAVREMVGWYETAKGVG